MSIHRGEVIGEREGLRVIECRVCGFAHLEQLPEVAALARYYESGFWQRDKPGALEMMLERREWWQATYGDWLSLVERTTPGRRLLDVGCGYGLFMDTAQERDWVARGIEPSSEARQIANCELRIANCGWEEFEEPAGWPEKFDCLSALWLLEHLPDPISFLYWARAHVHDNGALLIVVPNDFSATQMAVHKRTARPFYWLDHTHCNYWNGMTLGNILGRAGFRIVERSTLFPMETYLPRLDYTSDDALGARLHRDVEAFDLSMTREARLEYYRSLAREGRGRELVVVAAPDV